MLPVKNIINMIVLIYALIITSCNQTATHSEKNNTDSSAISMDSMPGFTYDPAMDPLIVGAAFSTKLGDTLNMKMFEVTVKPGDSIALHTHPDHSFYVIEGGKIEVTISGMEKQVMDLKPGMGWIGGPITDFGKNIGTTTIKWVETDVYRPRGK